MNVKERKKLMAARDDARKKLKSGGGSQPKDYYRGIEDVLNWALMEL